MKRIALAVLFLALALSADSWAATSAASGPAQIHLEGGFGFPQAPDDFSQYWKSGLGLGAGIEVGVGKHASIGFDLDYNHHGLDQNQIISEIPRDLSVSGIIIRGGSASILTAMAALRLELPTPGGIAPYLKLGAGLGHVSQTEATMSFLVGRDVWGDVVVPSRTDNHLATSVGVGLRERTRGSTIGYDVEARWVTIATEGKATQMVPVRVGLHFGF